MKQKLSKLASDFRNCRVMALTSVWFGVEGNSEISKCRIITLHTFEGTRVVLEGQAFVFPCLFLYSNSGLAWGVRQLHLAFQIRELT